MNNLIQTDAEMKELNYEKFFGSTKGAETNERTSMSARSPDTMLSMTVLLLACLGLALLAHIIV